MNLKIWCCVFFLFFPHQVHAHCTLKQQNSWQRVGHFHWKRSEMFELYLCFRYQFKPLTGISVTPFKDLSLTVMTKRQEVQYKSCHLIKHHYFQRSVQSRISTRFEFTQCRLYSHGYSPRRADYVLHTVSHTSIVRWAWTFNLIYSITHKLLISPCHCLTVATVHRQCFANAQQLDQRFPPHTVTYCSTGK